LYAIFPTAGGPGRIEAEVREILLGRRRARQQLHEDLVVLGDVGDLRWRLPVGPEREEAQQERTRERGLTNETPTRFAVDPQAEDRKERRLDDLLGFRAHEENREREEENGIGRRRRRLRDRARRDTERQEQEGEATPPACRRSSAAPRTRRR
jgi:hypothetical protein